MRFAVPARLAPGLSRVSARAMEVCVALFGTGCSLYAVGQTVVFRR
jgi:hypothetical protein